MTESMHGSKSGAAGRAGADLRTSEATGGDECFVSLDSKQLETVNHVLLACRCLPFAADTIVKAFGPMKDEVEDGGGAITYHFFSSATSSEYHARTDQFGGTRSILGAPP